MAFFADPNPPFQPAYRLITNITQAQNAEVTTSFAHQYLDGQILRLYIPKGFGMQGADRKTGSITVTGDTTFTITIDTRLFNPFVIPVQIWEKQTALCVPVGELNSQLTAPFRNVLRR